MDFNHTKKSTGFMPNSTQEKTNAETESSTYDLFTQGPYLNDTFDCVSLNCFFSTAGRAGIVTSLFIVFGICLTGNALICYVVAKNRHMRTKTNISIFNLAINNILIAVFCMPVITIDMYIMDEWIFGDPMCKLVPFVQNITITASMLNLSAISIEKFLAVCFSMSQRIRRFPMKGAVIAIWLIAIGESVIFLLYRNVKVFDGVSFCVEDWSDNPGGFKIYNYFHVIVIYFTALITMCVLYTFMICFLRRSSSRPLHEFPTATRPASIMRRESQRKKAIHLLLTILISFALCWTPYHVLVLYTLIGDGSEDLRSVNIWYAVSIWLLFLNCASQPVLYGFMTAKYRKALKKSLRVVVTTTKTLDEQSV